MVTSLTSSVKYLLLRQLQTCCTKGCSTDWDVMKAKTFHKLPMDLFTQKVPHFCKEIRKVH